MPAPISIVVPTLNAEKGLPRTLQSLMPALTSGLVRELLFADGGSEDQTLEIADEVGALVVAGSAGRGAQLQRGVAAAQGAWVLILHADTELEGDWLRAVMRHMETHPDHAGYFQLRFNATGIWPSWVAAWANFRSRWFGLPYGDQGMFLSRDLYDRVGGYPAIPLMEDVALARALRGRTIGLDGTAVTSAERYKTDGWARRGARNLWTLTRYLLGVSPARLAKGYSKHR